MFSIHTQVVTVFHSQIPNGASQYQLNSYGFINGILFEQVVGTSELVIEHVMPESYLLFRPIYLVPSILGSTYRLFVSPKRSNMATNS